MNVREIEDSAQRSRICREILADLPGWFGLPESNARYEREVADLTTFAVGESGFLSLKLHFRESAEVYVMGVRQQVKTLGPSHPSERYALTRRFYESRGFAALEELHGLWDDDNPTLILVKHLTCRSP